MKRHDHFLNQFFIFLKLKIWTAKVSNGQKSCFQMQEKYLALHFYILFINGNKKLILAFSNQGAFSQKTNSLKIIAHLLENFDKNIMVCLEIGNSIFSS